MTDTVRITIDPDGDVVLAMPSSERHRRKSTTAKYLVPTIPPNTASVSMELLVSSKVLSLASPVFKTMFGPNFREGIQLHSSRSAIRVELPDDDFIAMQLLCRSLHHKLDDGADDTFIMPNLPFLAILCNKYDCCSVPAIQHAFEVWMHEAALLGRSGLLIDNQPSERRTDLLLRQPHLLITAYFLGSDSIFERLTSTYIVHYKSRFQRLDCDLRDFGGEGLTLPDAIFPTLAFRQNRLERSLSRGITFTSDRIAIYKKPLHSRSRDFVKEDACRMQFLFSWTRAIAETGIWLNSDNDKDSGWGWVAPGEIMAMLPSLANCVPFDSCGQDGCACRMDLKAAIQSIMNNAAEFSQGLPKNAVLEFE